MSVGQSLGAYLAYVHNTTADDSALKGIFACNTIAKKVSSSMYLAALPAAAERFGYIQPFIAEAAQVAANEVLSANEVWTLGDFWTGNVLVSAPAGHDAPEVTILDIELAKPGTAAFDIERMGAEMLCLARFRHQDRGFLLLRTFFQVYRGEGRRASMLRQWQSECEFVEQVPMCCFETPC